MVRRRRCRCINPVWEAGAEPREARSRTRGDSSPLPPAQRRRCCPIPIRMASLQGPGQPFPG